MMMETINVQILVSKEHLGRFCWKSVGLGSLVVCISPKLELPDGSMGLTDGSTSYKIHIIQAGGNGAAAVDGSWSSGCLKETCRAFLVIFG